MTKNRFNLKIVKGNIYCIKSPKIAINWFTQLITQKSEKSAGKFLVILTQSTSFRHIKNLSDKLLSINFPLRHILYLNTYNDNPKTGENRL